MNSIDFLLVDPLPDHKIDSHRWVRLFRLIVLKISDRDRSITLLKRMWTMRSAGMTMRRDLTGIKLVPLIAPAGDWPDMEFYEDIRAKYLTPFSKELMYLIGLVEDQTD